MLSLANSPMEIIFRLMLGLCSVALLFGTLLPLLNSFAWWIRIFDFPRIQISVLIVVILAGYAWLHQHAGLLPADIILAVSISLAMGLQLYFIVPYTPLYAKQMQASMEDSDENQVSIFIFNVLQENREVDALRRLIRETDPDIILLSETSQWWLTQLDGLEADYPYNLFKPQENHYGLLLYSRLALISPEVRFLVEPKIPSMLVQLELRSGQQVTFYGVHPRPPGLKRDESGTAAEKMGNADAGEREDSDLRDAELMLVAKEVAEIGDQPVIVGGDFNDVAWSHTTRRFQRIGGLLDPRVGRGLYNSFDARHPLMRYPLDHVFASEHFRFVDLQRLEAIGSDHFPMLVVLDFDPSAVLAHDEPEADAEDMKEAEEAIIEGQTQQ